MIKRFTATALLSVICLMGSASATASVVPGELLGVFAGNDTAAGLLANLGFAVERLARVETPASIGTDSLSNEGLTISSFALEDGEAKAGEWSYSGPAIANIIVLKAGTEYAVYLFTNAITDNMPNIGLWDTSDLDNKGLSHITAYSAVVPIPAAAWLLISALAGLGALRRTR